MSQWQHSSGFSTNSSETNSDFFNPENNLLWTENQEAAIVNTGHDILSSLCDYNCIPRDTNPDIGAYEWVSNDVIFTNSFE